MALLTAGDVKLPGEVYGGGLKSTLRGYNNQAQSSLANALGTAQGQSTTSANASGRTMGAYTGQALGRANDMASQGINNNTAGVLGDTALKDTLNQREFDRNVELAKRIGESLSPTMAQQILGTMGTAANAGLQGYALYKSLGQGGPTTNPTYGTASPSNYGYNYPQTPDFGYGQTYPNQMRVPQYPS